MNRIFQRARARLSSYWRNTFVLLPLAGILLLGQAQPTAGQALLAPEPPEETAPLFQAGPPMAVPDIDARPLLDQYRAMGTTRFGQPEGDILAPGGAPGQAVQAPEAGPALSASPRLSAQSLPEGAQSIPLGEASRPLKPGVSQAGCTAPLNNPTMDYGTSWYVYVPQVTYSSGAYYTPPHSIYMVENNDGYVGGNGKDLDAFGQPFYFPSTVNSFLLEYKIGYKQNSYGASDTVYFGLYTVDSNGSLIQEIAYGTAPKYNDAQWHYATDITNYDASFFGSLKGRNVALVFYTVTDGLAPNMEVYIDDVVLTLCTSTIMPTGSISGQVTQTGSAASLSDALLLLTYTPSGGSLELVDVTFPASNGAYAFNNLDSLSSGDYYRVWYLNDGSKTSRLSLWAGSQITSLNRTGVNFDIKDVALVSPAHEAQVTLPITFQWNTRLTGETYYLCVYDMQTLDEVCTNNPISGTSLTINAADLQGISGFTFGYGRRYGWYLWVVGNSSSGIGFSYYARAVTFVTAASTPPGSPPPPSGAPPSSSAKDWTVMIYMAGDNNLGDPERYPNPTHNLQGQFAALKQLAASYPNINLVTLTDFYDNSGTQVCHLKPDGTQACQQLGEKDTSSPTTLADFITSARANFPATRSMLIIADHGHGINGLAADETTSPTAQMTPDGLRQALQTAGLASSKVDVLFYNACLMGNFEAVYDASSFAHYLVASANEVWVINIYDRLLPLLTSSATTRSVAIGIVNAYKAAVDATATSYFVSSAAYDLSKVSAVNSSLSALASAMSNDLAVSRSAISTVRGQAQLYDSSGEGQIGTEDAFVDMRDLATRLGSSSATTAIKTAASNLLTALGPVGGATSLVVGSQQVSGRNGVGSTDDLTNASGLALYFPNGQNTGQQPTLTNDYLNKSTYQTYNANTQWDEFVRVYVSGALAGGPTCIQSGARPVSGQLPGGYSIFLPLVRR